MSHVYNGSYSDRNLERVAYPLGGMGAGMFCIDGAGGICNVSLRHSPDVFNDPLAFAAVSFPGTAWPSRVLSGPVADWKIQFPWGNSAGNGAAGKDFGLPRFESAGFRAKFPFGIVSLSDDALPVCVEITGWSPFIPGNADDSSLPVAALEYTFQNTTDEQLNIIYSFNASNFMSENDGVSRVRKTDRGFILEHIGDGAHAAATGAFCAEIAQGPVKVNPAWFRGGWFDSLTMLWDDIDSSLCVDKPEHVGDTPSPGGTVAVPVSLDPHGRATVRLLTSWYVPYSTVSHGNEAQTDGESCCADGCSCECYRPWYAGRFASVTEVAEYWRNGYDRLRNDSDAFTRCLYETTLPDEVTEAVTANLSILKSPTVLRQTDGRLWLYEGCCDTNGCCHGSCTHVWNYAQAIPHLFPDLERSLRETELKVSQDENGHQVFRTPLPIAPADSHASHSAADGQLGGIIKLYRDWRISGDTDWLKSMWPAVKKSLEYCIELWDPDHTGTLVEPHHNTYDIEFWGPDGMCTSIYLVALEAFTRMSEAIGEDAAEFRMLLERGRKALETELFDGEFFVQDIRWTGLKAGDPTSAHALVGGKTYGTEEAVELLKKEGPKYQYGTGCLSDGVLGVWFGLVSGIEGVVDDTKVASHLSAVYRYNFKPDLSGHANPQRPTFALRNEGGLLLCSWPKGGALHLPFVYSNEVWTGIEYQVASHLFMCGRATEALNIIRACRDRYDGTVRNPFDEIECGHWYARALASYSLIQACSGVRYDAVNRTLYVRPTAPGDIRVPLSTQNGFGSVVVDRDQVRLEVARGAIEVDHIEYVKFGS